MLANNLVERYSRQMMLDGFGEEAQRRLLGSSVLIVGAGGLGAAASTYITGAGVGHIGIADHDTVNLSNLQRQTLYTEAQVGLPKTECARRRLASLSSHTRYTLYPEGLTAENAYRLAREYDLVVDCTDNFPARYLIDDACAAAGTPWVYGAIGEFDGRVSVFGHRRGRRFAELYPDRELLESQPRRTSGVIGAVPGVVGAIEAAQAINILTGLADTLEGRLFTINILTLNTSLIEY